MNEPVNSKSSKRQLKVYRGHHQLRYRHTFKAHPVIRLGGLYLSQLDFQIGDAIEVTTEQGRIIITKVKPENV